MPFLPLRLPPGFFRNGTRYQAKGRWHEGNLVRWHEGTMRPVGNWERVGDGFRDATNLALRSNDLSTSPWVDNFTGTYTARTSHYGSGAPSAQLVRITDDPVTAPAFVRQPVGTLPATPVVLAMVLEREAEPTGVTDIEVRDTTVPNPVARVRYNWDTGAASITSQAAAVADSTSVEVRVLSPGPGFGPLVRLIVYTTPANGGNGAEIRLYPIGADATSPGEVIVHHVAYEQHSSITPIIFTTTASVTESAGRIHLDGPAWGALSWKGNDAVSRLALGTSEKAYAYISGSLVDITPAGFTSGDNVASVVSALYGNGEYGSGLYGEGEEGLTADVEVQTWQFDTFGQFLVAHAHSDGKIYKWELDAGSPLEVVSGAPVDNEGVVVTPEGFLVALGAGGDGRLVQWADQRTLSTWTPTSENQAGDFPLATSGTLVAGKRGRRETLLWTTRELWSMQFIGGTLIYTFRQLGTECGPISRRAMAVVEGGKAIWMGRRSFFLYDGHVQALPSSVGDFMFRDLNRSQASQIHTVTMAEFNEVWWFYPDRTSTVPNKYVKLNYVEGHWDTGTLGRTAGVDRGAFPFPILVDRFGVAYQHETGDSKLDFLKVATTPFADSGPIEIATGDNRLFVREIIPDELTLGDVEITLFAGEYPTTVEESFGPFTPAKNTSVRVNARQVRLRADQVNDGWRVGEFRLEIVPGEMR